LRRGPFSPDQSVAFRPLLPLPLVPTRDGVGTLDDPGALPPDVRIFTASKQPWVILPEGARVYAEFYDYDAVWPAESLARRAAARGRKT